MTPGPLCTYLFLELFTRTPYYQPGPTVGAHQRPAARHQVLLRLVVRRDAPEKKEEHKNKGAKTPRVEKKNTTTTKNHFLKWFSSRLPFYFGSAYVRLSFYLLRNKIF